ncbi:MAG: GNAT family N-acetyltransferase [Elusimicrobia bacterium]|nr:GNAT family N-acetyltransferase [Elusimicrobiota bacterium]
MIKLKALSDDSLEFAFQCLKELRGRARYSLSDFERYVRANHLMDHSNFEMLVGYTGKFPIGILTCNRFAMPRYLGFGYELEEVIICPSRQGQGYGKQLVRAFLRRAKSDKSIRKVIVKTDDQVRAGKLYKKYFSVSPATVYHTTVNLL